jgi:hypothetical protein
VAHLARKHPELEIIALVRNARHVETIQSVFPQIKTIIGDLDSVEIIEQQSAEADIVLRKPVQFPWRLVTTHR